MVFGEFQAKNLSGGARASSASMARRLCLRGLAYMHLATYEKLVNIHIGSSSVSETRTVDAVDIALQ